MNVQPAFTDRFTNHVGYESIRTSTSEASSWIPCRPDLLDERGNLHPAVIGYLVSLGGSQVYSASATVYLGQPYSPTGGNPVITPQTNPSSVGQVINAQSVADTVANLCHLKNAALFKKGISSQTVATPAIIARSV